MSRPLRIIEPGLWHHVTNRGRNNRPIFRDDKDRQAFLDLVGECSSRWQVRTVCFCLMDTHYHLIVRDDRGNLSRAMRHVDGVYTQAFNRKYRYDGALMRGRYLNRVVQIERYVLEVVRYLHVNPIEAGMVDRAGEYPWSSHRCYLGEDGPDWLLTSAVWELFGVGDDLDRKRFDEFVHQRIDVDLAKVLSGERWSPILGDAGFVDTWRERIRGDKRYTDREFAEARRLLEWSTDEVIDAGCELFEIGRDALLRGKRGSPNLPRMICLLVCRDTTPASLADIGRLFGVAPGAVSSLASRARTRVGRDPEARDGHGHLMARLEERARDRTRRDPTGIHQFIQRLG